MNTPPEMTPGMNDFRGIFRPENTPLDGWPETEGSGSTAPPLASPRAARRAILRRRLPNYQAECHALWRRFTPAERAVRQLLNGPWTDIYGLTASLLVGTFPGAYGAAGITLTLEGSPPHGTLIVYTRHVALPTGPAGPLIGPDDATVHLLRAGQCKTLRRQQAAVVLSFLATPTFPWPAWPAGKGGPGGSTEATTGTTGTTGDNRT